MAQRTMPYSLMRGHGVMWATTNITTEPLDYKFVSEEFMRVNGNRRMSMLIPEVIDDNFRDSVWNQLIAHDSIFISERADSVQNHTSLTRKFSNMGRLSSSFPHTKSLATAQNIFLENMSKNEGIFEFD